VRAWSTQPTLLVPLWNGMYQNQPGWKLKIRMLPASLPGQRRPPWKWAKRATLPSPSMGRRRPWRVAMKASRPLASTRKRARISRVPSGSETAAVTPSSSKATRSTVVGWSSVTFDCRAAWSSRILSNSPRCTS
jgi:hypothetical protein